MAQSTHTQRESETVHENLSSLRAAADDFLSKEIDLEGLSDIGKESLKAARQAAAMIVTADSAPQWLAMKDAVRKTLLGLDSRTRFCLMFLFVFHGLDVGLGDADYVSDIGNEAFNGGPEFEDLIEEFADDAELGTLARAARHGYALDCVKNLI